MSVETPAAVFGAGPRAVDAELLARVAAWQRETREDPSRLALPARIVVPSAPLREHVLARIAEQHGAVAGVQVQTLRRLALEIVAEDPTAPVGADLWLPVALRRAARAEPELARCLEPLDDGYAAILGAVTDLLDAGLTPDHAPAVVESVAETVGGEHDPAVRRAQALVRVAAELQADFAKRGFEHASGLFRRATERLEADPAAVRARAVLVHGYADVTGTQLDLIDALVRCSGACVLVDLPPDPVAPNERAPGSGFTDRLTARLGMPVPSPTELTPVAAPRIELLRAAGAEAEAFEVARRIRTRIDEEGCAPEGIAIVGRALEGYRVALHAQLTRWGIPFSGGPGYLAPEGRRVRALLELLESGARTPVDRWLDVCERLGPDRADLRLALHGMGAGRLGQVPDVQRGPYRLALRRFAAPEDDAPDEALREPPRALRASRRELSGATLGRAMGIAERTLAFLEEAAVAREPVALLAALRRLLFRELGWSEATPGARELAAVLARAGRELPIEPIDGHDLVGVLRRASAPIGASSLGGAGGGVRLLSVTEARAQVFEHLFVVGVNRDVFPRIWTEDPILPDRLRRAMEAALPDVPIKFRGHDEERYLFAQLCAASPQVVLSWQEVSDDGKERQPSALVERLRLHGSGPAIAAPPVLDAPDLDWHSPFERAVQAGIAKGFSGHRAEAAAALAVGAHGRPSPEAAAAARLAALLELDAVGPRRARLGPGFGLIGPVQGGDPRVRDLYVTTLEAVARCPWQAFLEKLLGVEPVPDALAELPAVSTLVIGNVVHEVLEGIVRDAIGSPDSLEAAFAQGPGTVPWPDPEDLAARIDAAARGVAREQGIVLPGFARFLARRSRPALERVHAVEWGAAPTLSGVLGAELEGAIALEALGGREVRFRADRVDAASGGMAFVDYKAGKPVSLAVGAETRAAHLVKQIRQGRRLQAVAYAVAAGPGGEGRYVFARDGDPIESAVAAVASDDSVARAAFDETVGHVLACWDAGAFVPRLVDGADPPQVCDWCDVRTACSTHDTTSRHRFARWRADTGHRAPADPADAAVAADPADAAVAAAEGLFELLEEK